VNPQVPVHRDPQESLVDGDEGGEDHVWFEDRWMVASLCDE
jgi:hypothetical protein